MYTMLSPPFTIFRRKYSFPIKIYLQQCSIKDNYSPIPITPPMSPLLPLPPSNLTSESHATVASILIGCVWYWSRKMRHKIRFTQERYKRIMHKYIIEVKCIVMDQDTWFKIKVHDPGTSIQPHTGANSYICKHVFRLTLAKLKLSSISLSISALVLNLWGCMCLQVWGNHQKWEACSRKRKKRTQ